MNNITSQDNEADIGGFAYFNLIHNIKVYDSLFERNKGYNYYIFLKNTIIIILICFI